MPTPKEGDTVRVHYTGKLEEDDTVFDASEDDEPLSFTLGEQTVIPGFEQAVTDMEPGDSKTVTLAPEQAYGPHREDMLREVPKSEVPGGVEARVGQQLQLRMQDGQTVPVLITEVKEETITLDANHPLAGRTLVFDIELIDVEENGNTPAE